MGSRRTSRPSTVAGGTATGATYDAQDRLTAFGTTSYSYNNAGDLISSVGTAKSDFSYDIYGNLLSVRKPTGTTITYNTDPLGRRIKKSVNGTMVQGFLWADELHPIAELDGAGKLISTFIYAEKGNVPSAMLKGGYEYRIISDQLGSVRLVVNNNNGSILQQLDYDPYGRVIVDTNPGFQPFGYAGGLYDRDTGLVRFGRRDYDPVIGRWTSKDPIGFAGGLNLYGYVVQDPVNLVDPNGLKVVGLYDGASGKVIIVDTDTGEIATMNAYSGGRLYEPILDGSYEILGHPLAPAEFFRLEPVDSKYGNDIHDTTGRSLFRLHRPGSFSMGCVTAKDADSWKKVSSLIGRTRTTSEAVPQKPGWWSILGFGNKGTETLPNYGTLIVRNSN